MTFARKRDLFQFVRDLLRPVALPIFVCRGIVAALEKTAGFLGAHDDGHRAFFAALLGVNLIGRNKIDIAWTDLDVHRLAYFRMVGLGPIVDALITLDGFGPIKNAIQCPIVSVVVYLRAGFWRFDKAVDHELVVRVFVKKQVLRAITSLRTAWPAF